MIKQSPGLPEGSVKLEAAINKYTRKNSGNGILFERLN